MPASSTCSTVAGSTSSNLAAFSYSSSLLLPPAPSSGSETGLPPPPPPPPPPPTLPPPPVKPLEQTACRLRLLSPGPEQQLPTPPAPQGTSTRPETTTEFALPSHCTTGAPAALGCGEAGRGRALASIRRSSLDVCGVAWYVHGGGEALVRDPERPARAWGCDSEPPRLSGSSVWSPPPAVEAGFFFGRIVIAGQLAVICVELHTENKRPFLLVYEQFVRCMYGYTCPNIIREVGELIQSSQIDFIPSVSRFFFRNNDRPRVWHKHQQITTQFLRHFRRLRCFVLTNGLISLCIAPYRINPSIDLTEILFPVRKYHIRSYICDRVDSLYIFKTHF